MNPISKFGITLFSGSSVLIFILKAMTDRSWAVNTSFYAFLKAFAVVLPVFFAISITMIVAVYVKSFIILIIIFASALAASFVAIAPIFLGGL